MKESTKDIILIVAVLVGILCMFILPNLLNIHAVDVPNSSCLFGYCNHTYECNHPLVPLVKTKVTLLEYNDSVAVVRIENIFQNYTERCKPMSYFGDVAFIDEDYNFKNGNIDYVRHFSILNALTLVIIVIGLVSFGLTNYEGDKK
jgi:hypothetical protein